MFVYTFGAVATTATYNGVSMTAGPASGNVTSFYIFNPATGSNTVSTNGGATRDAVAVSYSGTDTSALDGSGTTSDNGNSGAHTASITTSADNCWAVFGYGVDTATTLTAGTATTKRVGSDTVRSIGAFDNGGPKTPAGSVTLEASIGAAGSASRWLRYSIKPAAASSNSNFLALL